MSDELLSKRIEDMATRAVRSSCPAYGDFYESQVRMLIEREITRWKDASCMFWGAQDYALRQMLSIFPTGDEPACEDFPLAVLWIFSKAPLLHPQVMGALLGLGIEVGKVGDISILPDRVQVTLSAPLKDFVMTNLLRVDKYDVTIEEVPLSQVIASEPTLKELCVVVPSVRVDCLVGECFNLSRAVATAFVKGEKVRVNHQVVKKPSHQLKEGDLVSVLSKGRFIFSSVDGATKKGNVKITISKFV